MRDVQRDAMSGALNAERPAVTKEEPSVEMIAAPKGGRPVVTKGAQIGAKSVEQRDVRTAGTIGVMNAVRKDARRDVIVIGLKIVRSGDMRIGMGIAMPGVTIATQAIATTHLGATITVVHAIISHTTLGLIIAA